MNWPFLIEGTIVGVVAYFAGHFQGYRFASERCQWCSEKRAECECIVIGSEDE